MLACLMLFLAGVAPARADEPPKKKGDVAVAISMPESPQSAGCPIVLELKLTNVGKERVGWWCGGPERYPGAEHFVVQIRYNDEKEWNDVEATNGQYTQGSGGGELLAPGESIRVPLAIPVPKNGVEYVSVRITPRDWNAAKRAETGVLVFKDKKLLDLYRARLIAAAVKPGYSFERHLAHVYADSAIIDTLVKLIEIDNEHIVAAIAKALAHQKELPAAAGEPLAKVVRQRGAKGASRYVAQAALMTESESARTAVLELLNTPDTPVRAMAADVLRMSPGDVAWLKRVRAAIVAIEKDVQKDPVAAKNIAADIKWLDLRIGNEGRKP